MILLLIALVLVPIGAFAFARQSIPRFTATMTLMGFGLVVSPLSLGLYATFFLGPFGFLPGMVGLLSGIIHGSPGFWIASAAGLIPSGQVVEGIGHFHVHAANGLFWGFLYGLLGFWIDGMRRPRNPH